MALSDIVYKMAFSFLKSKITGRILKELEECNISPEDFFTMPTKDLIKKAGLRHDHEFDKIAREEALSLAQQEFEKIQPHHIKPLYLLDEGYPTNLAETEDAPIILYKLGEADLDAEYSISVVGTRKPSPYGVDFCNKFLDDISTYFPDSIIVSGLAFGIDATAHKKSLERGLCTVAVLAHGLNMIYPAANRGLAKEIVRNGGALLSEYPFGEKPFRSNFLARNRIVAGLSDVTVVAESKIKGGAMSTANYAFLYNRDVMALPGRAYDELSGGCNLLIRKNKAHLIECVADMMEVTGWQPMGIPVNTTQRNLFPELEGESKIVYEFLKFQSEPVQFDVITHNTRIPVAKLLAVLGELEFDGLIIRYPGNRFSIA